jgi:hypothetical protein
MNSHRCYGCMTRLSAVQHDEFGPVELVTLECPDCDRRYILERVAGEADVLSIMR